MVHSSLSHLIDCIERGTRLHICVAFLEHYGNRKTRCRENQTIHDRPICLAMKKEPGGMERCFHCRIGVQNAIIHRKRSMEGLCINGVYEYCRPVIHEGKVICALFIGNILTNDPRQRAQLEARADRELLDTMEPNVSPKECEQIADLLESYILFLFERYGNEPRTFDPLIENIKSHIRENLSPDLSLKELAATFHYSPKYLGRLFKARTGQSIREYCNLVKVRYAETLLLHSNLSVETVAARAGFGSINYFDRIFHQITGCSPKSFRKREK